MTKTIPEYPPQYRLPSVQKLRLSRQDSHRTIELFYAVGQIPKQKARQIRVLAKYGFDHDRHLFRGNPRGYRQKHWINGTLLLRNQAGVRGRGGGWRRGRRVRLRLLFWHLLCSP